MLEGNKISEGIIIQRIKTGWQKLLFHVKLQLAKCHSGHIVIEDADTNFQDSSRISKRFIDDTLCENTG